MPSKYRNVEDLPKPGNTNVSIKETPAQMLAAISWRCADRPASCSNILVADLKPASACLDIAYQPCQRCPSFEVHMHAAPSGRAFPCSV